MLWVWIAVGGALGAVARHALSSAVAIRLAGSTAFPGGTLAVNVLGCFAAGLLLGLASRAPLPNDLRAFLAVGLLGGFTTFSAFGADTFVLVQSGQTSLAVVNVAVSVVTALAALWFGAALTA